MSTGRKASPPPAMDTEYVWGDRDPEPGKYSNGDFASWAEEVRMGPYTNPPPPSMPTEYSDHPASNMRAVLARKAKKCIVISEAFLGRTASVRDVEDHALGMMDWTDRQVNAAYEAAVEKLSAKDDDKFVKYEEAAEDVEEESWEDKKAALGRQSRLAMADAMYFLEEDKKKVASIMESASNESKESSSKECCDTAEAPEEDSKEIRALKACLDKLSKMPEKSRLKRIAALGKIIKMADENVSSLFNSERLVPAPTPMGAESNQLSSLMGNLDGLNEHSELLQKTMSGQLGQGFSQGTPSDLDPLGMNESESFEPQTPVDSDDDEVDEFELGEEEVSEEPEDQEEPADEDEFDIDAEIDGLDEEPEPVKKTASVQKPKPKKMSRVASPKKLGSMVFDVSNEIKSLSGLWSSSPDVSEAFGVAPTNLDLKDY